MQITDYELFQVPPRWLFLRVETSDGLVGWGEPIVEGRAATVRTAVEELMDSLLVGEDPTRIEDHWQTMYRGGFYRGGPVLMSAIAGIDQALWDIKGKQFGAPVYELLGGRARDRVRIYQGVGGDSPEEVGAHAAEVVDEGGLTAVKTSVDPTSWRRIESPAQVREACEYFGAVRDAVGDDVDAAIDFHGRISKPMAKRLVAELEEHEPMFVEEPVLAEHNDALGEIAGHTSLPIATGERLFSRAEFKPLLESQAVDVVQPDLSHAGGITEVHKIASMAEAYDVALAPHCPLGPISLASCIQIDVNCPNALIQEQSLNVYTAGDNSKLQYLEDPSVLVCEDGYVEAPTGPGLGIEVDEEYVREQSADVNWHNPVYRHDDGGIAEW